MRLAESGEFEVGVPPADALSYLADADAVCRCLPGEVHAVRPREGGGVTVELTASHAGASEDVRVRFSVDADRGTRRVAYTGHGLGSRAKVDLDGEFSLTPTAEGTRVEWAGSADVGGLLSSLNRGVAEVAVREKLAETADNVRLALERRAD